MDAVVTWKFGKKLKAIEKEILVAALHATRGNVSEAAFSLGVSRSTLYRKMFNYNLENMTVSSPANDSSTSGVMGHGGVRSP